MTLADAIFMPATPRLRSGRPRSHNRRSLSITRGWPLEFGIAHFSQAERRAGIAHRAVVPDPAESAVERAHRRREQRHVTLVGDMIEMLERIVAEKLTFGVSAYDRKIVTGIGGAPTQISGIVPVVDDGSVRRLNARYAGRRIWGRGGLGAQCILRDPGGTWGAGGPNSRPYTILHIFRIYRSSFELGIGGQIGAIGGGRQSAFVDESPLVVWLDVPSDTTFTAVGGTGSVGVSAKPAGPRTSSAPAPTPGRAVLGPNPECAAYFAYFADGWDLNRAYSLVPPPYPQTGVKVGMTHEQVAWQIGYPAAYGSAAWLDSLEAWRYDNLPPFSYWVYFGADGRVTKYGPDGQLP